MSLTISRSFNHLLDRYIETCSHYSRQLKKIEEATGESELSKLVDTLEGLKYGEEPPVKIHQIDPEDAQGQNIVPTQDTLDALRDYCADILERLTKPHKNMPRNLTVLQSLLERDVLELASLFDSFTLAWDKIVDISRLTSVEDPSDLFARDTVVMSLIEFGRLVDELVVLNARLSGKNKRTRSFSTVVKSNLDYRVKVTNLIMETQFHELVPQWDGMVERVSEILKLRWVEKARTDQPTFDVVRSARADIDFLTMFGLQLAFFCWRSVSEDATHRKIVIKSLLYYSRLLLEESDWQRAYDFNLFARELTQSANEKMGLDPNTGTSMLTANMFYAKRNIGHIGVNEAIEAWNVSEVHPRYDFLKKVLLRDFEGALPILDGLLKPDKTTGFPNFSQEEVLEWPILSEFRASAEYDNWKKQKLEETLQ